VVVSLERFRALLPAGDRNYYLKNDVDRVELCTRTGYRAYAAWMTVGNQPGLHVRALAGVKSNGFRGRDHNWVYLAQVDWDAVAGVLAESKRLATMRGGGRKSVAVELYKPLAKGVALLSQKPERLHAGGPRAKIFSGERDVAVALARACKERMVGIPAGPDDDLPPEKLCANMEKAAGNAGSQSCMRYATLAVELALGELEKIAPAKASVFAIELDELILRNELSAAHAHYIKTEPPAFTRVLWRGADAKSFPAFWIARLESGEYGFLAKLGGRWGWHVSDRDNTFATVPVEMLDAAIEMTVARDV
jgi:hypothetical protein